MKELINHIIGNAKSYIKEYETKDNLTDKEKGMLMGLWMDLDSINNHIIDNNIKFDESIEDIMKKLNTLINK